MIELSRAFYPHIHTITHMMAETINQCPEDEKWMEEALREARKGIGLTSPNPPVGAVIVRGGRKLAGGWHRKAGTDHAERDALAKLASGEARGATIYVTLEPCSTIGRTGSCTAALIEAGVGRVVYATDDPNPDHVGGARERLASAGIEVSTGVLKNEARKLIRGFAMVQTERRPWVIAKTAISLDGRITRPPGEGRWLTSKEAREQVHFLRFECDAIITSGETIRKDDPALTIRGKASTDAKQQPARVVMTRKEIKYDNYRMFTDESRDKSQILKNISPGDVLKSLALDGHNTVLLESGGELMGTFLDEGLIDEFVIFYAPLLGGGPVTGFGGQGVSSLANRISLKNTSLERFGPDLCLRGEVDRNGPKPLER
ncbi:MAG: bifunctional diaminohydroxyphosphoribosylaminopyrimidine deaminase/5-amino-6-(5-phosphoribosylamino)uracil reductase RibD [Akkermansiaceae bacterium]